MLPEPGLGRKLFKQFIIIGAALFLIIVGCVVIYIKKLPLKEKTQTQIIIPTPTTPMIIASEAFHNDEYIPGKYTCDGLNMNPPLRFAEIPEGTLSLALIADDPDAVSGDWSHWVVWNIRPDTSAVQENSVPAGATVGKNDFGNNGYGGPCPPSDTHHYEFKLYALDTMLGLPKNTGKKELMEAMQGHVIIEAKLTGLYSR